MPTIRQIHPIEPILTAISSKYRNPGLVADRIFPRLPVSEMSGTYFIYGKEGFDIPETRRAAKSAYNRVEWALTTDTYKAIDRGLEDIIDDAERKVMRAPIDLDVDTTEGVTDQIALAQEKRIVDIVTSTSYITQNTTLAGANQWNQYSSSDPINDVETGKQTINAATGKDPNSMTMVISGEVFDKIKHHHDIVDRIKYSMKGIITTDLLAQVFTVKEVLVAYALYNTANKGQTASLSRLWGKDVLLCSVETAPGLRKASLGYNFEFDSRKVRKFRDANEIGDVIRVTEWTDEKLISASCGYLIKSAVA